MACFSQLATAFYAATYLHSPDGKVERALICFNICLDIFDFLIFVVVSFFLLSQTPICLQKEKLGFYLMYNTSKMAQLCIPGVS